MDKKKIIGIIAVLVALTAVGVAVFILVSGSKSEFMTVYSWDDSLEQAKAKDKPKKLFGYDIKKVDFYAGYYLDESPKYSLVALEYSFTKENLEKVETKITEHFEKKGVAVEKDYDEETLIQTSVWEDDSEKIEVTVRYNPNENEYTVEVWRIN